MKRQKIVLSSTYVDRHNDRADIQVFVQALPGLTGNRRMRWNANHRRDLPPFGYISEVKIEENGNHAYLVGETFPYEERKEVEWDNSLFIEQSSRPFPLLDRFKDEPDHFKIYVDKNNFKSLDDIYRTRTELEAIFKEDIEIGLLARKAENNVPELAITLGKMYVAAQIIKPFATKFLEALAEKAGEATLPFVRKSLKAFGNTVTRSFKLVWEKVTPKDKGMSLILEFPGDENSPHIFLYIKARNPEDIQKAFTEKNFAKVKSETEGFVQVLQVEEITFALNENGHFGFRYLVTRDGATVGKKGVFKDRDKLGQRMVANSGGVPQFSIGAEIKSMILPRNNEL